MSESVTGEFKSFDNSEIFFRKWDAKDKWNKKVVILLHRGHEHSKRLEEIALLDEFSSYKVYSYDYRGHGYTKTFPSYEFMDLVRDLDAFVKFVCESEDIKTEDIFLIANSVAGVVASTWIHDYAPNISGIALVAPAFKIKLYFPFAKEFLALFCKIKPKLNIKSYVKSKYLSHLKVEQDKYDSDELITPNIPAKQLVTLLDSAKRVVEDANMITVPTLVLVAQNDYVVDKKIQGDFYANLTSETKKIVPLEDSFHGVLYDIDKQKALDEIFSFMNICFAKKSKEYLDEVVKFTSDETARIVYGSDTCANNITFGLQRFMIDKFGFISDGISKGIKYGFDSGVTLDYVYENSPSGKSILGKIADKYYLESIGWRGIRQRKANMIKLLTKQIKKLSEEGKSIKILDIAGGPARYLVDICKEFPNIEVLVQDYQIQNINEGEELAKKFELKNITYKQADAFDKKTYKDMEFKPNIVVISGVFELFSDNKLISNAIFGVKNIIDDDGYLFYTGQPWHPQLRQIAKTLGNHQQGKWAMRRRGQYELDLLFQKASFFKEEELIDDWGIFTVSRAKINK